MKLGEIVRLVNIENGGNGTMLSISKDVNMAYFKLRKVLNGEAVFTQEILDKLSAVYKISDKLKAELEKNVLCELDRRAIAGFKDRYGRDAYIIPSFEDFVAYLLEKHDYKFHSLGHFARIIRTSLKKVSAIARGEDVIDDVMLRRILRTFDITEFDRMVIFHYSRKEDESEATSRLSTLIVFLNDSLKYNHITRKQFDSILDTLLPTKAQQINNKLDEAMDKLDISSAAVLSRIEKCNDQEILKSLLVILYNINYITFVEVVKGKRFESGYKAEYGRIIPWKDEVISEDLSLHDHLNTTDWINYCVEAMAAADKNIDNK